MTDESLAVCMHSDGVVAFNTELSCLHSIPEHELKEESRDLEEEQEAAGRFEHMWLENVCYLILCSIVFVVLPNPMLMEIFLSLGWLLEILHGAAVRGAR